MHITPCPFSFHSAVSECQVLAAVVLYCVVLYCCIVFFEPALRLLATWNADYWCLGVVSFCVVVNMLHCSILQWVLAFFPMSG